MDYIRVYGPFVLMFDIKTKWSRGRQCRCSPSDSRWRWEAAPRSAIPRSRSHFTVRHSPDEGWWEGSSQRDGDEGHTPLLEYHFCQCHKKTRTQLSPAPCLQSADRGRKSSHCGQFRSSSQCVHSRSQSDVTWHQWWFIKAAGKCSVLTCSTRRQKPSTLDWLD